MHNNLYGLLHTNYVALNRFQIDFGCEQHFFLNVKIKKAFKSVFKSNGND